MPVTKTAKRALRSSKRKEAVNKKILANLEIAIRLAKKSSSKNSIEKAISLTDRAVKKKVVHKNKAARIKSRLNKLTPSQKTRKSKAKTKTSRTSIKK